jgi:enoyl-CoA hydratase/carnithine racemase
MVKNDRVTEIILNRPPVNALNHVLIDELIANLKEFELDDHARVLIIRSELSVFVAGADIKMMNSLQEKNDTKAFIEFVQKCQTLTNYVERLSKPTIAYISGHAMGGGLELALGCDFRFMTKGKARVGLPEGSLGLIPGGGGTQRLTRLLGETKAKEIIYFSKHLSAEEAKDYGVVSHIVSEETGLEEVRAFAEELAEKAPIAISSIKRAIQSSGQHELALGLEHELLESAILFNTEDIKIGFESFLQKKKPNFIGR